MMAVVLLPGLDGTGSLFSPLEEALAPEVRTQIVSYPAAASRYEELSAFVLSKLPKRGRYVVLGESFSGPVAIAVAARKPVGLVGLILSTSFVCSPRSVLGKFAPLLHFVPSVSPPTTLLEPLLLGRFASKSLKVMFRKSLAGVPPATLKARLQQVATVDVSAQAQSLTIPTLYLQAKSDRLVPASAGDYCRKQFRRIQVCSLEGPHFLLQANPTDSAKEIVQFIDTQCVA